MSAGFFDAAETGVTVDEADFVVVGSGAGGGAAARALARGGARVVVLEEGPFAPTDQLGFIARDSMNKLFRAQGKMAAFGRAATPILQGRCVGGTTFVNSAIVWRMPDKVVQRWHDEFGLGEGLSRAALEDAYKTIEEETYVRQVVEGVNAGRSDVLMRDGAERAHIEGKFLHRYEKDCRGSGRCLHGCPNEAKQSTTINYLQRAVGDGGSVFANAGVTRVIVERDRAVGVAGRIGSGDQRGRVFQVRARRAVIVAASVVQSPNLLRRSNIRRPELGDHFMAHPGTTVMALYPDRVDMWTGASQGYEVLGMRDTHGIKLESINVPPEVVAARFPGVGRRLAQYIDRLPHVAAWSVAVRAEAEGRIRPSRIFGDLVTYNLTERDLANLRQGMKKLAEMHFLAGATEVITGVHGMPEVLTSIDEIKAFDDAPLDARAYSLVATHLFGGCRAGRDAGRSVVDPNLRVHGIEGLYVMDGSVFPTNTGVNPQHSIMAVATVAARRLVA